ncbi:hypothetical protein WN48_10930 [Eufriesea mexicana]|uniref:Uncharacterized protein n=1 Tax=Eufriesea mexicana TaxID=516756 RepID=A0A310SRB8_9HYME|nr:hypothetical protein WN48_10930 [Eufriesea mexicana]
MKLLVSTRGPCWAVAGQDRHFASQPHGVELNHPCGLTVDGTSPSASMCPSPSRVRLRQRTAPSRSEDALIRGGHPGTRCMTRLTVTGNECRRRVVRMTYEACTYRVHESTSRRLVGLTTWRWLRIETRTCALVAQPTGAVRIKDTMPVQLQAHAPVAYDQGAGPPHRVQRKQRPEGHPGTRCLTRLTVAGNECRRRVVRMTYETRSCRVQGSTSAGTHPYGLRRKRFPSLQGSPVNGGLVYVYDHRPELENSGSSLAIQVRYGFTHFLNTRFTESVNFTEGLLQLYDGTWFPLPVNLTSALRNRYTDSVCKPSVKSDTVLRTDRILDSVPSFLTPLLSEFYQYEIFFRGLSVINSIKIDVYMSNMGLGYLSSQEWVYLTRQRVKLQGESLTDNLSRNGVPGKTAKLRKTKWLFYLPDYSITRPCSTPVQPLSPLSSTNGANPHALALFREEKEASTRSHLDDSGRLLFAFNLFDIKTIAIDLIPATQRQQLVTPHGKPCSSSISPFSISPSELISISRGKRKKTLLESWPIFCQLADEKSLSRQMHFLDPKQAAIAAAAPRSLICPDKAALGHCTRVHGTKLGRSLRRVE